MVACCSTNVDAATGVYMSVDSGVTWTEGLTLASASADWYACAVNSDGTQAIAVVTAGRVYMGTVEPTDYHVHLLPDTTIEMSTLQTANKVYCVIDGVAGVSTATNTTVAPTYASSPREILIVIKGGSTSTVAAAQLAFLQIERYKLDGLPVSLRQGLGIQRGYRQWVVSPRAGVELCLPVRRVQHDFGSNVTTVDLGEFAGARDDMGALLEIAKRLDQLAKEAAI